MCALLRASKPPRVLDHVAASPAPYTLSNQCILIEIELNCKDRVSSCILGDKHNGRSTMDASRDRDPRDRDKSSLLTRVLRVPASSHH